MLEENIKMLRKSFSLSQVELAHVLGVSKQCVSNWENDYIQPSIDMLKKIAAYFAVSTDCLLDIDATQQINVSGLSDSEIAHVRLLINDLLGKK